MIELRWLNTSWEEMQEIGFKDKSERVLQYRYRVEVLSLSRFTTEQKEWSEWKEVEEEFIKT